MYLGKSIEESDKLKRKLTSFVHRWVKTTYGGFIYVQKYICSEKRGDVAFGVGFNSKGEWRESLENGDYCPEFHQLERIAKLNEIQDLLLAEAKRRNYKSGNYKYLAQTGETFYHEGNTHLAVEEGDSKGQFEVSIRDSHGEKLNYILEDGKWAEIDNTVTYYRGYRIDAVEELRARELYYHMGGSGISTDGYSRVLDMIINGIPLDATSLEMIITHANTCINTK